jgi:hypothetical protein
MKSALDWLLEDDQPSVKYLTLTQLLGRKEMDAEVKATKSSIAARGWAAEILPRIERSGCGSSSKSFYTPKYLSTNWMLLILSDLGLTKDDPKIAESCELWIEKFSKADGGFGMESSKTSHLCIAGNTARALVKFGYIDHPAVERCFEWFVKSQAKLGGWSCWGSGRNLDSWEPLSAFAVYPREKWNRGMKDAVEKGAEFFLERELHKQGGHYEPWYRFHYPMHYYYDLLVGLDFMTALGYSQDKRLEHAVEVLKKKKDPKTGCWNLDAIHPDVEGGTAEWYKNHPKEAPISFALEKVGEPSKMITLKAMAVLERLNT